MPFGSPSAGSGWQLSSSPLAGRFGGQGIILQS